MDIATFEREKDLMARGYEHVIGIDEAGRGPLAGPVVAAACLMKDVHAMEKVAAEPLWNLVRDSKKLSAKQREEVYDFVYTQFFVGFGLASPETIDRMNILQATFLAMKAALGMLARQQINRHAKTMILLDGNQLIPNTSYEQQCIAQGDKKVKSIAAASIIAKVTRDHMMVDYDAQYPQYGFAKHKGYGTKVHMDALCTHGACPIHRKTFAPVKRVL